MATITKNTTRQSLLSDAFEALLERLGPEKTAQVWRIFVPSKGDYMKSRRRLFGGKNTTALDKEIKKFNQK